MKKDPLHKLIGTLKKKPGHHRLPSQAGNSGRSKISQSVVRLFYTKIRADYDAPWQVEEPVQGSGSGSIINQELGLILTCAHTGDPRNITWVRLGSGTQKYPAKVLISEHDCDLALLQVEDPEFRAQARQVELGQYQPTGNKVTVVGYPFTGEEITSTTGIVSNNEIKDYVHGNAHNLASMVTAAINPGNSGGPVFDTQGKQVGVAFQGINAGIAEGAGYIIPMTVVNQFLEAAYRALSTNTAPKGIPDLPLTTQSMMNPAQRAAHHMKEGKHTGIRVKSIDTLANVGGLMVNDIILSIDGHAIQNDGTINSFPEISERLDFSFLVYTKQIGDTLDLRALRDGKEIEITLPLTVRTRELKLLSPQEYTTNPTFYIKGGICFQPVTDNYVQTDRGSDLTDRGCKDGASLIELSKKTPDEELVVINRVFNCELTAGYGNIGATDLVESVNGKKINNLKDVVIAMETNRGLYHNIDLKNKRKLVLYVATPAQEQEIAQRYQLPKLHSENLKPIIEEAARSIQAAPARPMITSLRTKAPANEAVAQPKAKGSSTYAHKH